MTPQMENFERVALIRYWAKFIIEQQLPEEDLRLITARIADLAKAKMNTRTEA